MSQSNDKRSARGGMLTGVAWIFFAFIVIYFSGFFVGWSIAARLGRHNPMTWAIYKPIPIEWKMRMGQFWWKIDPKSQAYLMRPKD